MVPRFTPFALALAGLSATYAYADNTHTSELDTVEVHAKRLNMETGYKAERSNITGVNTSPGKGRIRAGTLPVSLTM